MGLNYLHLDETTRAFMLAEIERDIAADTLYVSDNLTPQGRLDYPELLRAAARAGTDVTLADSLGRLLNTHEKPRQLKSGGFTKPPVMRRNAHEMLAEGELNRFYMRALCLRAIEEGHGKVVAYRAKAVEHARTESDQKIGQEYSAKTLLNDLRAHPGVDTALGLPSGPNSGLSIRLP